MSQSEFKTDGLRYSHQVSTKGKSSEVKDDIKYSSFIYTGEYLIDYRKPSLSEEGIVVVQKNYYLAKTLVSTEYDGAPLLGICPGDIERVDHILKDSKGISLKMEQETVGTTSCYKIEGQTESGHYRLWLDPGHDFNLIRLEVERKAQDKVACDIYSGKSMNFTMSNVEFQKVDGYWVPMKANIELSLDSGKIVSTWNHKRTKVVLNPDHKTLKSFVAKDIPDETRALQRGIGMSNDDTYWFKGQVVTKELLEKLKNEKK